MKMIRRITDKIFINYGRIISSIQSELSDAKKDIYANISRDMEAVKTGEINLENRVSVIASRTENLEHTVEQFKYVNNELLYLKHNENAKNILIAGFYGAPNLGDELMLTTLLEHLKPIPNLDITILLCDNPDYDISHFGNVKFIHYPKTMYDFNIIANNFDYVIFGGGAIIDDSNYDAHGSYKYDMGTISMKLSLRAIALGKKVVFLGCSSVPSFTNESYIKDMVYVIDNCEYFSVRDEESLSSIIKASKGSLTGKIHVLSDIVLANELLTEKRKSTKTNDDQFTVGLVWIFSEKTLHEFEIMLSSLKKFATSNNYKKFTLNLIPFYDYCNQDERLYKEALNELSLPFDINVCRYTDDMQSIINNLTSNDFVIAMRYHAILLCYALDIPCLPICYDQHAHYFNKLTYLNKQFGKEVMLKLSKISMTSITKTLNEVMHNNSSRNMKVMGDAQTSLKDVISKLF